MSMAESRTQTTIEESESSMIPTVDLSDSDIKRNLFAILPRRQKKIKPINRGNYENSKLSRVHQLDMKDPDIKNIPRAGVLFYTFIGNELHLCFARDIDTGDLTDFGGGRRRNETPVKCGIREGNEESRHAFGEITPEQVRRCFCLYSSNMLIIFIPVASPNDQDIREITRENFTNKYFLNKKQSKARCYNENSEIIWQNEAQISNLFSKRPNVQMFAKVRRFIYSCTGFSQNITVMKNILRSAITGINCDLTLEPTKPEMIDFDAFSDVPSALIVSRDFSDIYNPINGIVLTEDIQVTQRFLRAVHSA